MLTRLLVAPLLIAFIGGLISTGLSNVDELGITMPDPSDLPIVGDLGDEDRGEKRVAKRGGDHGKSTLAARNILNLDRSADPADCRFAKRPVRVKIDATRYPASADHLADVIASGDYPRVWHLDRTGADQNREESLEGIPTQEGMDRDELPPASSLEGGEGAHIRHIPYADNRGSGSSLGAQLSEFCSGQAFRMIPVGG